MVDVADVHRELEALRTENQTLRTENETLKERAEQLLEDLDRKRAQIGRLEKQLDYFIKRCYGPRSEKFDPKQLALAFLEHGEEGEVLPVPPFAGDAPDDEDGREEAEERDKGKKKRKKRRRSGRLSAPANAPRERVVHDVSPEERICPCCAKEKTKIGEDVTEEVDFRPAALFVREHVRPRYACAHCGDAGVVQADLPARPIERGKPGPGLLAQVIVAKFADHLPLARLSNIFAREQFEIPRSTLCDWIRDAAFLLDPIYHEIRRSVLDSHVVQCDETAVRMQINWKRGGVRSCRLWSYVGDKGEVFYDFTLTREGTGPARVLRDYQGYLQADAFSGFDPLFESGKIVEVGCWAHARRYFVDAMDTDPRNASWALALIQALYRVEKDARERELTLEKLHAARQDKSAPAIGAFREWSQALRDRPVQKDPLGAALQYVTNQWDALKRFLDDPRLSIDNNACERSLRSIALGRKNWLFAGSEEGGRRAAVLYSLVETCRMQGIAMFDYLRDVLDRVSYHPSSRIHDLTPRGWKAAHNGRESNS